MRVPVRRACRVAAGARHGGLHDDAEVLEATTSTRAGTSTGLESTAVREAAIGSLELQTFAVAAAPTDRKAGAISREAAAGSLEATTSIRAGTSTKLESTAVGPEAAISSLETQTFAVASAPADRKAGANRHEAGTATMAVAISAGLEAVASLEASGMGTATSTVEEAGAAGGKAFSSCRCREAAESTLAALPSLAEAAEVTVAQRRSLLPLEHGLAKLRQLDAAASASMGATTASGDTPSSHLEAATSTMAALPKLADSAADNLDAAIAALKAPLAKQSA